MERITVPQGDRVPDLTLEEEQDTLRLLGLLDADEEYDPVEVVQVPFAAELVLHATGLNKRRGGVTVTLEEMPKPVFNFTLESDNHYLAYVDDHDEYIYVHPDGEIEQMTLTTWNRAAFEHFGRVPTE